MVVLGWHLICGCFFKKNAGLPWRDYELVYPFGGGPFPALQKKLEEAETNAKVKQRTLTTFLKPGHCNETHNVRTISCATEH